MTISVRQFYPSNFGNAESNDQLNIAGVAASVGNVILVAYDNIVGRAEPPAPTWNGLTFTQASINTSYFQRLTVFKLLVTAAATADILCTGTGWQQANAIAVVLEGSIAASATFSTPVTSFRDGTNGAYVDPSNAVTGVVSGDAVISFLSAADADQGGTPITAAQTFTDVSGQTTIATSHQNNDGRVGYLTAAIKTGAGTVTMGYAAPAHPQYIFASIIVRGDSAAATIDSAGTGGTIIPGADNAIATSNMGTLTGASIGRLVADTLAATGGSGTVHFPALGDGVQFELFGTRTLTATNGVKSATFTASLSPPAGWNFVTLADPIDTSVASIFEGSTGQLAGDQVVFSTASFTSIDAHGIFETSVSGTQFFYLIPAATGIAAAIPFTTGAPNDLQPSAFTLTNATNAVAGADTLLGTITVAGVTAGVNVPVPTPASGVKYSISTNGGSTFGALQTTSGNVQSGNVIRAYGAASNTAGASVTYSFSYGSPAVSASASVTTAAPGVDLQPSAFTLAGATNAIAGADTSLGTFTVAGVTATTNVPVGTLASGVKYRVSTNGGSSWGALQTTAGNVQLGNVVEVFGTASNTPGASLSYTFSYGSPAVSATASVTTANSGQPPDTTPVPLVLTGAQNVQAGSWQVIGDNVIVSGTTPGVDIAVTPGPGVRYSYQRGGIGAYLGPYTAQNAVPVQFNDALYIEGQASTTAGASVSRSIDLGGVSSSATITTAATVTPPSGTFALAAARVLKVSDKTGLGGIPPGGDLYRDATGEVFALKDPDEVLDYGFDWSDCLPGDAIATASFSATNGLIANLIVQSATLVGCMVSGGTLCTPCAVSCRITTTAGRTAERTIRFEIRDR